MPYWPIPLHFLKKKQGYCCCHHWTKTVLHNFKILNVDTFCNGSSDAFDIIGGLDSCDFFVIIIADQNFDKLEIGVIVVKKLKGGLERWPEIFMVSAEFFMFILVQVEVYSHCVITAIAQRIRGMRFFAREGRGVIYIGHGNFEGLDSTTTIGTFSNVFILVRKYIIAMQGIHERGRLIKSVVWNKRSRYSTINMMLLEQSRISMKIMVQSVRQRFAAMKTLI